MRGNGAIHYSHKMFLTIFKIKFLPQKALAPSSVVQVKTAEIQQNRSLKIAEIQFLPIYLAVIQPFEQF